MKKNIYISAIYVSPKDTMGGNTKIIIELINNLSDYYTFTIFTTELETFRKNLCNLNNVTLVEVPYSFKKFNYLDHFKEVDHVYNVYKKYFSTKNISADDYFYSASDFGPDVLPIYKLKNEHQFKWIASLYLFIPNPLENITKKYRFPFIKYLIYFLYQRYIFKKILEKSDLCLITNDFDKKYFPQKRSNDILAIYGGVNVDQIESAQGYGHIKGENDVVFCGRLHQQKGISQLLDIWSVVVENKKDAKLRIIGNGEKKFEEYLKKKAEKLNIKENIQWLGYVNNEEKYKIYFQSKLLVHSTIYDNNGMVATEALCSGLPVVMYDIEELKFYTEGCVKVPIGNKKQYSMEILRLLTDKDYYEKIRLASNSIEKMRRMWNWDNRAAIFKKFIENHETIIN